MSRVTAGVACHLLLWCSLAFCQDNSAPGAPETSQTRRAEASEADTPQVQEQQPTVYWLPDKDGKLQAVFNFTYEEFEELYRLKEGFTQRDRQPRYSVQRILASGTADTKQAELAIEFGVLVRKDGWVRVPLRLDGVLLREPPTYEGPGEQYLHFEEGGKGYVSWIRGRAGERHQLTLKMLARLANVGGETRLELHVPKATWSELRLKVGIPKAVGGVSQGATLETRSAAETGETEFKALWRGGDFQLTWHEADAPIAKLPKVLEAVGAVLARIDGRSVETEATLSVRSYGAPFDRFRVRLPEDATLVPGSSPDYTVEPVDNAAQPAPSRRLVEVRLTKGQTSGPIEVRLATRRSHDPAKPDEWFELAGFEVVEAAQQVGAIRQWGQIAVAAVNDWQVRLRANRGVRQVEVEQLPETLRHEDVIAGFDYLQPCSLTAQVAPRKTRISVEPEYLLLVDAHEVRLEANLNYTVRGAKAFKLDVALPSGWEFVKVEPENLAAVDGVAVIDSNVLSIPLLEPSTGRIELRMTARWPIPAGAESLVFPLPQPLVNSPGPAAVVVAPADNVELTPNKQSMVELTRQQIDPQVTLPDDRQQTPLFYRGEPAKAVFAADFQVHAQSIAVEVASRINLDKPTCGVEQTLAYTIKHERTSHFMIEVPRGLAESAGLELMHEGQPVPPPTALPDGTDQDDASGPVRMRVALPEACIGLCSLTVRYPVSLQELLAGEPVPLVMPGAGELIANRAYVTAAPDIKVQPGRDSWTVIETAAAGPAQKRELRLATDQRTCRIPLAVELADRPGSGQRATVVERAWVRTWLTHSAQQDRAVFYFTSSRKELRLVIPAGAAIEQMKAWLDGAPVVGKTVKQGRLVIPLPEEAKRQPHVLELLSHSAQPRQPPGRLSIALPQLGDDVWVQRLYWQLVLPKNEHVVTAPRDFTSEFTWGWDGYFWRRKPLMDQSQLEAWSGASTERFVPEGVNCYLFSSMGYANRCELRTAGRTWIVLFAAGAALGIGLLLIYVPVSRHPGTLFGVGVVLLCIGILHPEPTLLLSQSASLGLALALLAGLLERSVARRRRGTVLPERPSSILEEGSTQTQHQPPAAGNQVSTQTAPPLPPSTSDPNA